jgi:hypothetical protein
VPYLTNAYPNNKNKNNKNNNKVKSKPLELRSRVKSLTVYICKYICMVQCSGPNGENYKLTIAIGYFCKCLRQSC